MSIDIKIGNNNFVNIFFPPGADMYFFKGRDNIELTLPYEILIDLLEQFDKIRKTANGDV